MTFGLTTSPSKELGAKVDLAGSTINPSNLANFSFSDGIVVPNDLLIYSDQASADAAIDSLTETAELYKQSTRVVNEWGHVVDAHRGYVVACRKLRNKLADNEVEIDKAFAEWQTLKHKVDTNKKTVGTQYAADVESMNVGYGNFERGLAEKLTSQTDESRSGSMRGSYSSNLIRFPQAV